MEEVLSIKMLNLKNKSHFYHLGRGGGGGGRRERERSQHPTSVPFENQETPPPHPQDPLTLPPLFPSEKW